MSVKSMSEVKVPLFSEYGSRTGKYSLKMHMSNGTDKRITNNGASINEFQALLIDEKTNLAVIRRHVSEFDYLLYIVNYKEGTIWNEIKNGTKEVKYLAEQHALYFTPFGKQKYSYEKKYGAPLTQTVTIPWLIPSIRAQVKSQDTIIIRNDGSVETHPLMVLSAPEIKTAAKRFAAASNPGVKKAVRETKRSK